jgi:putative hydrolase of the HAD superfamily
MIIFSVIPAEVGIHAFRKKIRLNYRYMNSEYTHLKAIAFDFWGVFAEMKPPMNEYLRARGISVEQFKAPIHDLIIKHDLAEISEQQFLEACGELVGIAIPYPEYRFSYREENLNSELINIIKKLKIKYKIALLSNNNKEYCEEYVFNPGLDKLFDVMVLSYQAGYRKPSPEIYALLVKQLEIAPRDILFLDDDPEKLPAAAAEGLQTLVYKRGKTDAVLKNLIAG